MLRQEASQNFQILHRYRQRQKDVYKRQCEARVVEKLSSMAGVNAVTAKAADGSIVVTGENLDRDALAQAIEDLGFDVIE